jgi:hypothetical protein
MKLLRDDARLGPGNKLAMPPETKRLAGDGAGWYC